MMATAGKTEDLHVIFKMLGDRGQEGKCWKKYTENVLVNVCHLIPEYLNHAQLDNCFLFRPYGSAVEDLKSLAADDIGDLDIVITSKSEDLLIHDEMIEYLPQHPLHVRIKGRDHPLLQSCLVEHMPYVATSAIKNLHPLIYGTSAPYWFKLIDRLCQAASGGKLCQNVDAEFKNKEARPAAQVEYTQWFGPLSGRMEPDMSELDPTEYEWVIHYFLAAKGLKYTKEMAEIFYEYIAFVNESKTSWREKGLFDDPRALMLDILSSDRGWHLWTKFLEMQKKLTQNESKGSGDFSQKTAKELKAIVDQSKAGGLARPCQAMPKEVTEILLKKEEERRKKDWTDDSETGESETSDTEQQPLSEKGKLSHLQFMNDTATETSVLVDYLLGLDKERKASWKETDAQGAKNEPIAGGLDFVPALRCTGWPQVARDWLKRERKWPSHHVVDKVVHDGFHLVVKPPKDGGNPKCDFRIAFNHAEYLLSQAMNDIQRECYRCLKKFHRAFLKDPKGLLTFHLKNLLLQTIEQTGAELWIESNRVECVEKLLTNLLQALRKKELPHFFVRSYNLFGVDYVDDPEILEILARKVEAILENTMQFAKELIQKEALSNQAQLEKKESNLASKPKAKTASEQGYGEEAEALKDDTNSVTIAGPSNRFHDLKDEYLGISLQVISLAFDAHFETIEALESVEKILVWDVKEMIAKHNLDDMELKEVLEGLWDVIYLKVRLNPEPNMRHRMLDAIRGVVETMKYIMRQEEFQAGNLEALAGKIYNPGSEDPFDFSNLWPAGIMNDTFMKFMNNGFTP